MEKKILEDYVYRNLRQYRNCLIGTKEYKELGKSRILKHLKNFGFNCNIKIINNILCENGLKRDKTIILEVV